MNGKQFDAQGHTYIFEQCTMIPFRSFCFAYADCEWKAKAGDVCAASFDWTCSGICKSVDRMKDIHKRCGEDETSLWTPFV
jgi:hypothetical protein